jgi:hypothetical protein
VAFEIYRCCRFLQDHAANPHSQSTNAVQSPRRIPSTSKPQHCRAHGRKLPAPLWNCSFSQAHKLMPRRESSCLKNRYINLELLKSGRKAPENMRPRIQSANRDSRATEPACAFHQPAKPNGVRVPELIIRATPEPPHFPRNRINALDLRSSPINHVDQLYADIARLRAGQLLRPTAHSCLGLEANPVFILVALAFPNSLNAYSRRASRLSSTMPTTKFRRKINEAILDAVCVFSFAVGPDRLLHQQRCSSPGSKLNPTRNFPAAGPFIERAAQRSHQFSRWY